MSQRARKPDQYAKAIELRKAGTPFRAISRQLGVSLKSVKKWTRDPDSPRISGEEAKSLAKEAFYTKNLVCKFCSKVLPYEKRRSTFCNHSCSSYYNNRNLYPPNKCARCEETTGSSQRKFCTPCLKTGARKLQNLEDARSDQARKRILVEKHGHRCQECKNTLWLGKPIPLELDHRDGNSDNNEEQNLRLLCPNCHALTPTYKGRNKGKGTSRQLNRMAKFHAKMSLSSTFG